MKRSYLKPSQRFAKQHEDSFDLEINRSLNPKPKRNSVSYRSNPKPQQTRSISVIKDPLLKQQSTSSNDRSFLGLNLEEIHKIFITKCEDLNISVFPDQEKRFFNYCWLHFRDRKFEMSESGIGSKCAKVIGNILKNNLNFAFVNLSKNSLKDSGSQDLLTCLKSSSHIVHLDISSNEITPEGAQVLFKLLENNESLYSLNISSYEGFHRNRLGFEGGQALSVLLSKNKILSYLNISGTALGPDGLEVLIRGLEKNVTLHSLNLANNLIGTKAIESLAIIMVATDIKELSLASNKIGNEGCDYLAKMIAGDYDGFCTVMKLDLSDNEISTKGLSVLLAAIRINIQLTCVYLKKNDFSSGLSEDFLQFLTDNNYLETLDFSNCSLKCGGLSGIGEGLSRNKALKTLVFSCNKIQDRGVEMICYGLSKNKILTHLDLSGNEIKNKGAVSLSKVLKTSSGLQVILLKDNSIKDSGGQALCEAARFNQNILKISLELNPVNFKFIAEIKDLTKVNDSLKKKKAVPVLISELDKHRAQKRDIEGVFSKIGQKKKEKFDAENRLKAQGEKLEQMKAQEKEKLEELKNQYSEVKSKSYALSAEIESLNSQIHRAKLVNDKQASEMSYKIGLIANQIKENENKKYCAQGKLAEARSYREMILKQYKDELFKADIAKKLAESVHKATLTKLEMKKKNGNGPESEVENLNPLAMPKAFLASEKLASSKKQGSVSPVKQKKPKKRNLSFNQK